MDKIIKKAIIKKISPYCIGLMNSARDFVHDWICFGDMQDHVTETAEAIWNEAIETAAQEADTNGDFATSNSIRTYKITKVFSGQLERENIGIIEFDYE